MRKSEQKYTLVRKSADKNIKINAQTILTHEQQGCKINNKGGRGKCLY